MTPHAVDTFEDGVLEVSQRAGSANGTTNGINDVNERQPHSNGVANGHHNRRSYATSLKSQYVLPTAADELHDLVCVGFGPASLAVAVAIHDALEAGQLATAPRVLFLEKQGHFAWHAGMLLPGAKMQISFIKDMASLRDPRSNFTFLNYLHRHGRLVEFTNLGTFLPARNEYEDYLRWCAGHFDDVVSYGSEVLSVHPQQGAAASASGGPLDSLVPRLTLGQPSIPRVLPAASPKVVHSSQYAHLVPRILTNTSAPYRVAVVGAGQSAAEIFSNIQMLYPNSRTWMVMRSEFLKPSDDSPFVNSIFNPEFVDSLYPRSAQDRRHLISSAKATNYGVVRLELIEKLYELMYDQRRELGTDERQWPHRIMGGRRVLCCEPTKAGDRLRLRVKAAPPSELEVEENGEDAAPPLPDADLDHHHQEEVEEFEADLVIAATGYKRDAHVDMLQSLWPYLPEQKEHARAAASGLAKPAKPVLDSWEVRPPTASSEENSQAPVKSLEVGRDYRVQFSPGSVAAGSGVWLQGCCEGTHGLSDTLLSILSTRSGDLINSMFGPAN
ncbi:L-ornithine 5-monooxygenase (L-ornithine N(5)-oxygenase) [Magnaporthiopsis poae ATCC 64411]|uniref:L-ornithine N(5)-monooxygenase [NAD(P)H] n=1 Tax=Magnaporthiopsis poae (strain ATCC 64411 / 73-15) TaxID=644358 RepID=A0A0C4DYH4_MAGP6|nr:L-ornithine 5-monooxygenase (L-ornithine N(5)-oxygenase) [Magnaporthiopsis poae ATCC 64411]